MSNVLSTRRDLHQGQSPQAMRVSDVWKRRGRSKREKEETEGERRTAERKRKRWRKPLKIQRGKEEEDLT